MMNNRSSQKIECILLDFVVLLCLFFNASQKSQHFFSIHPELYLPVIATGVQLNCSTPGVRTHPMAEHP